MITRVEDPRAFQRLLVKLEGSATRARLDLETSHTEEKRLQVLAERLRDEAGVFRLHAADAVVTSDKPGLKEAIQKSAGLEQQATQVERELTFQRRNTERLSSLLQMLEGRVAETKGQLGNA